MRVDAVALFALAGEMAHNNIADYDALDIKPSANTCHLRVNSTLLGSSTFNENKFSGPPGSFPSLARSMR